MTNTVKHAIITKGEIVHFKGDGSKHKARDFYLVTEINYAKAEMYIQKFCGNQLRSKRYLVKLTDIYPALSSTLPSSFDKEEADDDIPLFKSNDEPTEIIPHNRSLSESFFSSHFSITNRPLGHYMLDSSQLKSVLQ